MSASTRRDGLLRVGYRRTRPTPDGLLYIAHRKFEAGRQLWVVLPSSAADPRAVLDGHEPTLPHRVA